MDHKTHALPVNLLLKFKMENVLKTLPDASMLITMMEHVLNVDSEELQKMENVLMYLTVLFQLKLAKTVFQDISLKETPFVKIQNLHVKKLEPMMVFVNNVIQAILFKDSIV